MKGKIKWFNDKKGYGFIAPDDGGKDLFVHHSGIQMGGFRSLPEGLEVDFEIAESVKGPKAVNVVAIGIRVVHAGRCYTSTGYRTYIRPADRLATKERVHGHQPERGHSALVRAGTIALTCEWGHGQDERPRWHTIPDPGIYGDGGVIPPPLGHWSREEIATAEAHCTPRGRSASWWEIVGEVRFVR